MDGWLGGCQDRYLINGYGMEGWVDTEGTGINA